jgi:MraZ protein
MLLGEYFHSLDSKGRVVLPSSFRRELEQGCVVAKGQDGQLMIYAVDTFEQLAREVINSPQDRGGRRFSRTVFGGADHQEMDKAGRVLVKPELRQFAALEPATEIAVVGVFNHVELWEKDRYVADRAAGDERYVEED